jgi:predicted MFS family arabinose efflux permease
MVPLIVLAFCMTMFGIPLIVFLPVFAKDVFQGGADTFTLLLCTSGAGSVTGALIVAGTGNVKQRGRVALLMLIVLGTLMSAYALSKSLIFSCVLIFLSGAALMSVFAMVTSLVQLITTDEMRGRVMSVYNVAFRGGMPFGSLLAGALIKGYSAPTVLAVNGVILAALGLYFLLVHRKVASL